MKLVYHLFFLVFLGFYLVLFFVLLIEERAKKKALTGTQKPGRNNRREHASG